MPRPGRSEAAIAPHWLRKAIYHSHIARSPRMGFNSVFPNTLPVLLATNAGGRSRWPGAIPDVCCIKSTVASWPQGLA